ncbi:HVO_0476 family zinc finger protein [Marine Group III euryarchaeote]|nr:HVO_0476 family zinc finger protein [Marine Group III euryarchaeote]|tara:strand:- start:1061 stop:1687 length:627 start_codon:yes stop_codon:yes gene_type:complete
MEELWLFCDICNDENTHQILKSRTSTKKGFSFQGVVKCLECDSTSSKEVNEEPPLTLKLRISMDDETVNDTLTVDRGILIEVGQTRPHPDGLILVTGLELPHKRLNQAYSQDNPIVWAKKATHSKIRFAVHDGDLTDSYKEVFEISVEFNKGMKVKLEDQLARIIGITLHGGKSVSSAFAFEIARVTCKYIIEKPRPLPRFHRVNNHD